MHLILGGGLAGMSTAYHLARELPDVPRRILEKGDLPGGLCRTESVDRFRFDFTGHYLHLRDEETIAFVEKLLGDELVEIDRRSEIHTRGVRLPFPFQANLHGLPSEVVARCIIDFVIASQEEMPDAEGRMPFGQWARRVFGDAIAEEFMIPYNSKQFGVAADEITAEWVAWAVPRPDLSQLVAGAVGVENRGLGYNPRFRYPKAGGIGRLPEALAELVASDMTTGAEAVAIDAEKKTVTLASGETLSYTTLVSTLPLPKLLEITSGLDGDKATEMNGSGRSLAELASKLRWSNVLELRLGIDRDDVGDGVHWIYFPESSCPFYRVGLPSNVCGALAPEGCSSLSIELHHAPGDPVPDVAAVLDEVRPHLEHAGLLREGDGVVVSELSLLDPAYVLFDFDHKPVTEEALERLERAGIRSIGRFGAWTYSYMERALIDGREAARKIAHASATVGA